MKLSRNSLKELIRQSINELREDKGDMDNDGKNEPDDKEFMDNKDNVSGLSVDMGYQLNDQILIYSEFAQLLGKTDDPKKLKKILEPTYGVIIYQEQVMQIAQVLSGFTAGEADILRRAMGKKKKS